MRCKICICIVYIWRFTVAYRDTFTRHVVFIVGVVNVRDGFDFENNTHGSSECHLQPDGSGFWPQSTHCGSGVGSGHPAPASRCDGAAGHRAAPGRISRAPGHQHSWSSQHPGYTFLSVYTLFVDKLRFK